MFHRSFGKVFALWVTLSLVISAVSASSGSTLQKIQKSGKITIGFLEFAVPFSYYDRDKTVIGYSIEYSKLVAEAIKTKLNRPDLKIEWRPITPQNRILLLQNNGYDFECTLTSHSSARKNQAKFSNTFFVAKTRILVDKESSIEKIQDLKNRRVVVTSGTTSHLYLQNLNQTEGYAMTIITSSDNSAAFLTLETGRTEAFVMDDVLLASEQMRAKTAERWKLVGEPISTEAYACMTALHNVEFAQLIDKTIAEIQLSGKALELYNRWFLQPIPRFDTTLEFPLSSANKTLFSHPNNKSFD